MPISGTWLLTLCVWAGGEGTVENVLMIGFSMNFFTFPFQDFALYTYLVYYTQELWKISSCNWVRSKKAEKSWIGSDSAEVQVSDNSIFCFRRLSSA